jgi:GR25 family glycosyltransferase involved in LPS biosynthesis
MNFDSIDKTILINLDERTDRLAVADEHLKECGIEYERFPAIKHDNGAHGLLDSMDKIFKDCIEKEYKNVLILEDDNFFVIPPVPFLNEILPQLPDDYHCLYLGVNLLQRPVRHSANILRIRSGYATNAILYSLEAMKLILPLITKQPILPYDILLMKEMQQVYHKCYCTYPNLCLQRAGYSDIEKKEIDWGKMCSFTYNSHTFNL